MSSYGRTIEPHTTYLSPRNSENFRIRMSLSLQGIGAALTTENEYTVVRHIIPGGPADLDKKLKLDDRIVGVAQADAEMLDVISWRLEDVVQLIRGDKGTVVRLQIMPKSAGPGSKRHEIRLVRDKVKLDEQAAKLKVLDDIPDALNRRVAVIDLPTFYQDNEARARRETDYRSAARDIRRLLGEVGDVAGVIVDLRGNSGGSLDEAADVTGLFIDTGPVVQMRYSNGKIHVKKDNDKGVAYAGPIVVLVDRFSASASEIFAGAIQDYRRGLILGEPTFGKGTVQHLVPLDNYSDSGTTGLGDLKLTVAQYFRVNGESTQHRGVIPDILFPTALGAESVGERALDNALEWSKTSPATFAPSNHRPGLVEDLRTRHEDRINADPHFEYLVAEAKALKEASDRKTLSLVEEYRRNEQKHREAAALARENKLRQHKGLKPRDPDAERAAATPEEEKALGDAVLQEAAQILLDMQGPSGTVALKSGVN
ncbi:MAG: carboxy terminal-processing peptidase, partial [Chromatiales bacterium]|nr:carboxy terminal-processing peptidase [Chromatiales bacterium]